MDYLINEDFEREKLGGGGCCCLSSLHSLLYFCSFSIFHLSIFQNLCLQLSKCMFVFESIFMQFHTDFMSFQCFSCSNYRDSKGQDLCLYLTQAVSIGRGWWLKEKRKLKTQQDEIKNYLCCNSTKLRNILISLSYFNSHFPNIIRHRLCQFDVPTYVLSLAVFSSGFSSLF